MSLLVRALLILGFFLPLFTIAALDAKSWFQDPKEWAKQDEEVFEDALDFRDWGVFAAHQKERTPSFDRLVDGSWARMTREVLPVLSNAVRRLRPGYRAASYRLFGQTNPAVVVGEEPWLFQQEILRPRPGDDLAILARALMSTAQTGCRIVPVFIPMKATMYPQHFPHPLDSRVTQSYAKLQDQLRAQGLPVVDLLEHFRALEAQGEPRIYHSNDTHLNIWGRIVAASRIAEKALGLPPQLATQARNHRRSLQGPTERHFGDLQRLLGFTKDSPLSRRFDDHIRRITPPNSRIEKDADIIWIGDSFSWTYDWLLPRLVAELMSWPTLEGIAYNPLPGQLPWHEQLARRLARKNAKVLVLCIGERWFCLD